MLKYLGNMEYLSSKDINSKVKEGLGERERYDIELSMISIETFASGQKPVIKPFYHVTSDTSDVLRGITTLGVANMGRMEQMPREKLKKVMIEVAESIQNNNAVLFESGKTVFLFGKKYVSFEILCSLNKLKNVLSNRNFAVTIKVKIT